MVINSPLKKYRSSNNIVFSCQYHVIFCPKYRRRILVGDIAEQLKKLLYSIAKDYDCKIIECEVMPDHVHLLLDVNPNIGIKKVVARLKGNTSRILREQFPKLKSKLPCLWTNSKFISTVGSISLGVVKQYIENQRGK